LKYRLVGIITTVSVLMAVFLISFWLAKDKIVRYVEHRDEPKKEECIQHQNGELCSHLPLVIIDTNGAEIPGRPIHGQNGRAIGYTMAPDGLPTIRANLNIVDNDTKYNHPTDTATLSVAADIRVRGHSSREFEKANYLIEFTNPDGTNNPQEFLGMESHHEWALHGPFLDKTLIRNYMWYNLSGEIMEYSPNVRFCEVIINGEYRGVYLATETITSGKEGSRLNLEVNKKDNVFSGYLIRLDWNDGNIAKEIYPFTNYTLRAKTQHQLIFPGIKNATPELKEAIKNDFSEFEKAIFSYDFNSNQYGYKTYIDVDSFVDYFLINELSCNYDAGSLSTYMYKDIDGKFKMCVWDFNSACDNYQESAMPVDEFRLQHTLWFKMLFMDSDFTDRVIERYYELRETYFSEEYLFNYIDDSIAYLGDAKDRNFEKWGYTFLEEYDLLHPTERNPRSYEESVSQMKDFLANRLEFMDENIESLRQNSAESKTKKYKEATN